MAKQVEYPADTVDSDGKVWKTVGENIRHGAKDSLNEILIKFRHDTLDAMFPIGYIFIGQLPEILKTEFNWASLITSSKMYGLTCYKTINTNEVPHYSTAITSVVLNNSELNTFNDSTGLKINAGAFQVPLYKRVS